jgi:serine/threonine protein kinase
MNPERRQKIEALFHEAYSRPAAEREAFLASNCGNDEALRAEVQALLDQRTGELLDNGTASELVLKTGTRLGAYEVRDLLGKGGMGEVYRAHDTRLRRDVAIKVLPREFTGDPERLARFEREARVLASLNHPNIGAIHGFEEITDQTGSRLGVLILELVEGETVADRLERGRIPIREALDIARQVALGLEAAHEKGVMHRDLKPANIKVRPDGHVKLLDFGLAKAWLGDEPAVNLSQAPTVTEERAVLGTPAYMSPEQASAQNVDKRTDIWAFGCLLFEMVTGHAAFADQTLSDTIGNILHNEPDWSKLPAGLPDRLRDTLRRCLEKDPRRRLRDIGDARMEIEMGASSPVAAQPKIHSSTSRRPWLWALGGFVLAALVIGGALSFRRNAPASEHPAEFTLSFAEQMAGAPQAAMPTPSPDGRFFLFIGTDEKGESSLWIRPLDSAKATPLPGTAGATSPLWSADGKWIAFYAEDKLKKVSPSAGQPQTIATLPGFQDPAWNPNGDIIFRPTNRAALFRIRESGGEPEPLTHLNSALGENSHRGARFLPDGRRFFYTSRCADAQNDALYIGSLDSQEVRRVMKMQSKAAYIPPRNGSSGALLFFRDGGLVAQQFDIETETVSGVPKPVISNVEYDSAGISAYFQVSADGRIVVVRRSGSLNTQLTWFERNGQEIGRLREKGRFSQPRLSPNGERVAFERPGTQTGNRDIWTIELQRDIAAPLTLNAANDWYPVWSPDGKQMLFGSDRSGGTQLELHIKQAIDSGAEEVSLGVGSDPYDWSKDGQWITSGSADVFVRLVSAPQQRIEFLATPFREGGARFSPDGKWLAYVSNETGHFEVYVRPFNGAPAAAEGKIQMSSNGGDFPVWRQDGQELFYMSRDFDIHAVDTSHLASAVTAPAPKTLFRACPGRATLGTPENNTTYSYAFDTLDGNRFLVNCTAEPPGQFTLLMNWSIGLQ